MTRICIDCRYIGPRPSGIAELVRALVRYVPELAPDLRFLLLRNAAYNEPLSSAENVEEVSVSAGANSPATMWWLPRIVDLSDVALFHAPANILPAGLSVPTLTTIHDVMWITHPHWCNPRLYGQIERRFYAHGIRRAFDRSSRIATISAATRDAVLALRPDIERRVAVTRSGVAERFLPVAVEAAALQRIGLSPDRRFVLTAGQYSPYKNHEGAILAFASAFAARDDIDLVMVQRRTAGAGRLRSLAHAAGIGERVHFTGAVSEDVLLQLYSGASALLHPSLCEGFGNPVAEAMACGCPVVTSDCSAMPEVAGDAALLVDPHDTDQIATALREVVHDTALAATMRKAGQERANLLSWKAFARQNIEIYRELLADA